ncbi:tRNA wybutosine-synthesizing protein 2 homolog isoform X2 [Ptychodera flava]
MKLQDTEFDIKALPLPKAKKALVVTPYEKLLNVVRQHLQIAGITVNPTIQNDLPKHWEIHGDLVVFQDTKFTLPLWMDIGKAFWMAVAQALNVGRIAKKSRVTEDGFRTPSVQLILGNDGWVEHIDNGIRYSYDVTKCMFSMGNITEKLRLAKLDCQGETVVDLYAGIGYFTLPYLVHAGASMVHACEWNANAVEALKRNLVLNRVNHRCVVHAGDNRELCPRGVADRVNLGLIPSSEDGWPVACAALKPSTGGILHIHGNVTTEIKGGSTYMEKTVPENASKGLRSDSLNKQTESDGKSVLDNEGIECYKQCMSEDSTEHSNRVSFERQDRSKMGSTDKGDNDGQIRLLDSGQNVTSDQSSSRLGLMIGSDFIKAEWNQWASKVKSRIEKLLQETHKKEWTVEILHVEHVKPYAPHIDHLVVDLQCQPTVQ